MANSISGANKSRNDKQEFRTVSALRNRYLHPSDADICSHFTKSRDCSGVDLSERPSSNSTTKVTSRHGLPHKLNSHKTYPYGPNVLDNSYITAIPNPPPTQFPPGHLRGTPASLIKAWSVSVWAFSKWDTKICSMMLANESIITSAHSLIGTF